MIIKKILKKILPLKIIYFLIYIRDLPKKIKIYYPKIILKFLITNIYDQNKKKMFTMRNLGGSTISRGFHIFKTDKEVSEWIENFEIDHDVAPISYKFNKRYKDKDMYKINMRNIMTKPMRMKPNPNLPVEPEDIFDLVINCSVGFKYFLLIRTQPVVFNCLK